MEKRDVFDAVSLVTGSGIVLIDRVNEGVMVELILQLQQHLQVVQLSKVNYLVLVEVSARTGCMVFRLARIKKVFLM